jgi:dTDP-4-amino-4,6-dideoxygalactose transaminase
MSTIRVPAIDLNAQHEPLRAEILEAVDRVLCHGQFVLGPEVARLEEQLANRLGVERVIGVGSGTDALILALEISGISPGDEVITVSHSFFATATAIVLAGATPVFVDVHPDTLTMDPDALAAAITPRTRAVMPVHLTGAPCDMARISAICQENGLQLIEDCAQALGARVGDRAVGAFGVGAFSLHPLKILSACGDGGFISLRDPSEVERLLRLRNLGLRDRNTCVDVSRHSRLDTLQAAILLVKSKYLDEWIEKRRGHARAYRENLADRFQLMDVPGDRHSVYTNFVIRSHDRDRLIADMAERGFDLKVHYPVPIHLQPAFARYANGALPVTERIAGEVVTLPITPELSAADRDELIEALIAWV